MTVNSVVVGSSCGEARVWCWLCFFFFSSRRRHTRLQGDWSSDVCSSDLLRPGIALALELIFSAALNFFDDWTLESMPTKFVTAAFLSGAAYLAAVSNFKIGRAHV